MQVNDRHGEDRRWWPDRSKGLVLAIESFSEGTCIWFLLEDYPLGIWFLMK